MLHRSMYNPSNGRSYKITVEKDDEINKFILHRVWYGQIRQGNKIDELFEDEENAINRVNEIIKIRKNRGYIMI